MPAPEVLSGMRAPRAIRLEEAATRAASANPTALPYESPEGVTVYVSNYRRYRVQVTAPHVMVNPVTGHPMPSGPEIAAQFEDGVYRNDHRDPEIRAMIDRVLQTNKYFGRFGTGPQVHFWLLSEQKAAVEERRVKSALDTLKSLPREQVEQFVAQLQKGEETDHKMPTPPAASPSSVRPIAPRA